MQHEFYLLYTDSHGATTLPFMSPAFCASAWSKYTGCMQPVKSPLNIKAFSIAVFVQPAYAESVVWLHQAFSDPWAIQSEMWMPAQITADNGLGQLLPVLWGWVGLQLKSFAKLLGAVPRKAMVCLPSVSPSRTQPLNLILEQNPIKGGCITAALQPIPAALQPHHCSTAFP